jgi:ADP-ribose pyrophosphatase YjhB (NUDIX family)
VEHAAKQVFAAYDYISNRSSGKAYRFCPVCAAPLTRTVSENSHAFCPACGWNHYLNPAPGVVILIPEGGKVLLGKRAQSSYAAQKWCLPGGFVEYGENFLDAAIREVREETGLIVEIRSVLSVCSNFLSPDMHTLVVVLHVGITGGKEIPGDDIDELGWFPLDGPFPDMAFEADRHIIERYHRTGLAGAPIDPDFAGSNR